MLPRANILIKCKITKVTLKLCFGKCWLIVAHTHFNDIAHVIKQRMHFSNKIPKLFDMYIYKDALAKVMIFCWSNFAGSIYICKDFFLLYFFSIFVY